MFEWRVTGVKALEAEIVAAPSEDPSENELLRPGPVIGQGQYKIDCRKCSEGIVRNGEEGTKRRIILAVERGGLGAH